MPGETEIDTHDLIKKDGGHAIFVKADASNAKDMESLVQLAVSEFGAVDM